MNLPSPLVCVAIVWALATPSDIHAQDFPTEPTIIAPIALGAALGLIGVVGGAYLGYEVDETCDNSSDFCLEPGFFLGAAVVGTVGASLGTHLGNRRRGSLGKVLAFSFLTWGAGVGTAFAFGNGVSGDLGTVILAALPAVQFVVTVAVERSSGRTNERRHRREQGLSLYAAPGPRGLHVGARLSW